MTAPAVNDPDPGPPSALEGLPERLPGHWSTHDGLEKAREYAKYTRADLAMRDATDLALANALYLATGDIHIQKAAKERMRWLSVQLALSEAARAAAETRVTQLRGAADRLRAYASHEEDCPAICASGECDCGYSAAIRRLAEVLAQGEG